MKKITSTTAISFLLSGSVPLEINEEGVIVSDTDAEVLISRLGGNINVVDAETPVVVEAPVEAPVAPVEPETAPETTEAPIVEETPAEEVAPVETVTE